MEEESSSQQEPETPETENNISGLIKKGSNTKLWIAIAFAIILLLLTIGLGFGLTKYDPGEPTPGTRPDGTTTCNDWSAAGAGFQKAIEDAANKVGIHPAMLGAIFLSENSDSWPSKPLTGPWPVSPSNAKGPFQIIDFPSKWDDVKKNHFTAKDAGDPDNFEDAALAAATYLYVEIKQMKYELKTTDEKEIKCLGAGYNAGPSKCEEWKNRNYGNPEPPTQHEYHNRVWEHFQELNSGCNATSTGSGDDKPANWFIKKIQTKWLSSTKNGKPDIKGKMPISGVVLHWTAGDSVESALSGMSSSHAYVQLIVDKDGKVYQLLPLNTKVRSGSGDGNSFAIGIEIVSIASNNIPANEQALLDNATQFNSVVRTVQYLIDTYKIPNVRGNEENLEAKKGIFGHYQTQSKDGSWAGMKKGCQGRKSDPGKIYMKKVWDTLGSTGTGC